MDKLISTMKTLVGMDISTTDGMSTEDKAGVVLDAAQAQFGVEKCMKPENLVSGGEKYINALVTMILADRFTTDDLIVEYINVKHQ